MSKSRFRRAIPADAVLSEWTAPDGWKLRRFDWPANAARGRVLMQGGRGDSLEKYLETFADLHQHGWSVTSFDWRGQGGSGRLAPEPHVGHVDDFSVYLSDLTDFWRSWSTQAGGPRAVLGHSMGGHVVLRALAEDAIDADAVILVAPMLGLRSPFGTRIAARIARAMAWIGDPARAAWRTNERPGSLTTRQKLLTSDVSRYADEAWWHERNPALRLGPPSWRWLAEAFASTIALEADPRLTAIATPILLLVADHDGLVDARATHRIASRLPNASILRFGKESAHEILREDDAVRGRAVARVDLFLSETLAG